MLLLVSFVDNMAVKFQHKETIMKHMGYITFQNSPDLAFLSQTKWKLWLYISWCFQIPEFHNLYILSQSFVKFLNIAKELRLGNALFLLKYLQESVLTTFTELSTHIWLLKEI